MLTIGNRIFTEVTRTDHALVEQFRDLPSSNINDEMNRLYCMHDYIRLLNPGRAKPLLGTAITVKAPIGDNLFFHQALDMPVYAKGVTPQGPFKFGPGEVNVPIACGGQVVFPGDILVGDPDGIVVIRRQDAVAVAKAAQEKKKKEDEIFATMETDWHAYAEKHVQTTQSRMAGKNVAFCHARYSDAYADSLSSQK